MAGMVRMTTQGEFVAALRALMTERSIGTVGRWENGGLVYPPADDGGFIPLKSYVNLAPPAERDRDGYLEALRGRFQASKDLFRFPEGHELCELQRDLQWDINAMARGPEEVDRRCQCFPVFFSYFEELREVSVARSRGDAKKYFGLMARAMGMLQGLGHFAQSAMLAEFGCAEAVGLKQSPELCGELSYAAARAWQQSVEEFNEPASERFRLERGIANISNAMAVLEENDHRPLVPLAGILFMDSANLHMTAKRYREAVEDVLRVAATAMRKSADETVWKSVHADLETASVLSALKLSDGDFAQRLMALADAAKAFLKNPPASA